MGIFGTNDPRRPIRAYDPSAPSAVGNFLTGYRQSVNVEQEAMSPIARALLSLGLQSPESDATKGQYGQMPWNQTQATPHRDAQGRMIIESGNDKGGTFDPGRYKLDYTDPFSGKTSVVLLPVPQAVKDKWAREGTKFP